MKNKFIIAIIILVILAGGIILFIKRDEAVENIDIQPTEQTGNELKEFTFGIEKKSAHYESNTPAHRAILAGPPINIVIDFNFDLALPSTISVMQNGIEYSTGETIIDNNKLSMRRMFNKSAPDGLYEVKYNACWPDGSCHDGNFQFAIDRSLSSTYQDLRGQSEVTISLSGIAFNPVNIIISPGTNVTWANDENIEHYINTDGHPAHTYYLRQNSRALQLGDTYSTVFNDIGIYPYHCSAHADVMTGNILVL